MYVCICNAITEKEIHSAIDRGVCDVDEIADQLGAGACCGSCRETTRSILESRRYDESQLWVSAVKLTFLFFPLIPSLRPRENLLRINPAIVAITIL